MERGVVTAPRFLVPITILTRVVSEQQDDYGNDVDESVSTPTDHVEGVFAPGGSVEDTTSREQVITNPTVFLPASVDVTAVDAVQVHGRVYEVEGEPAAWTDKHPFTGWIPDLPVVVTLRRVEG